MKRLVAGILTAVAVLVTLGIGAEAAPASMPVAKVGPYEGTFKGLAYGDKGSSAPLALELTHRGNQVEGNVFLEEGLYISAGFCGAVNLPATSEYVAGQTLRWNPRRLVVSPTFDVGGFEVAVDFESTVSADGDVIAAKAKVDLPWFCGRDPLLTATLNRS
jgi:hypothetical protein